MTTELDNPRLASNKPFTVWQMDDIQDLHERLCNHAWFTQRDASFRNRRVSAFGYKHSHTQDIYFIASERNGADERGYFVHAMNMHTGNILKFNPDSGFRNRYGALSFLASEIFKCRMIDIT